jgi:hypothetical protein
MKNLELSKELYESPKKEQNIDKYGEQSNQCICCGRLMEENEKYSVHMNTYWEVMHNSIITDQDAKNNDMESQGYFPVGNSCAKKVGLSYVHKNL